MAISRSLLLLDDLSRHGSIAVGLSSTPKTLLSWGTRIRFQRFSVGSCGCNRKMWMCSMELLWEVGGECGANAVRGARYSSGTLGGD